MIRHGVEITLKVTISSGWQLTQFRGSESKVSLAMMMVKCSVPHWPLRTGLSGGDEPQIPPRRCARVRMTKRMV